MIAFLNAVLLLDMEPIYDILHTRESIAAGGWIVPHFNRGVTKLLL